MYFLIRDGDNMKTWTKNIPIERYPIKPKQGRFVHCCLEVSTRSGIIKEAGEEGVLWA